MSRIGKNAIALPDGVSATISGSDITIKGSKGERTMSFTDNVTIEEKDGSIHVAPKNDSKFARQMWGTVASQVSGMIKGVNEGITKTLLISGVGFRAQAQGAKLNLALGFSHDVEYVAPEGISFETPDQTTIKISGIDSQKVGQVAAEIRDYRRPEPYKGKGIRYEDEVIIRKEGKKK